MARFLVPEEVLEPAGLGRELRVVFREGGSTWGVAAVHRETNRADFTVDDARLLADLFGVVAADCGDWRWQSSSTRGLFHDHYAEPFFERVAAAH